MMTSSTREIFNEKTEKYLKSMTNLAETITASAIKNVQEFPFVRVPKFELLGSHLRSIVANDVTIWAPLITEQQREKWSNFSASEIGWYNESLTIVQEEENTSIDQHEDGEFRGDIWEGSDLIDTNYVAAASPGPFAPLWQISPPALSLSSINYDLLQNDHIRDLMPALIQTNDCVMGAATTGTEGLPKSIAIFQDSVHDLESAHPRTDQLTPVFDKLGNNSSIVGFILSTIHWDEFLAGVFTPDINGVAVVIRNNCDQSLSYEVRNGEVRYIESTSGIGYIQCASSNDFYVYVRLSLLHGETPMTLHLTRRKFSFPYAPFYTTRLETCKVTVFTVFQCTEQIHLLLK